MSFFRQVSDTITIVNTKPEHGAEGHETIRSAFLVEDGDPCTDCISAENIGQQIQRFPEGQFVALYNEKKVVGIAATMRIYQPPTDKPHTWIDTIGDLNTSNHKPDGEWLRFGVALRVAPKTGRLRDIAEIWPALANQSYL